MTRNENLAMWKRIAGGELSDAEQWGPENALEWVQEVAKKMVQADAVLDANQRTAAIVRAAGLAGQMDKYAPLRTVVELFTYFSPVDEQGNSIPQTQGQNIAGIVRYARAQGLLTGVYLEDDKKAKDLIRSLLPKRI